MEFLTLINHLGAIRAVEKQQKIPGPTAFLHTDSVLCCSITSVLIILIPFTDLKTWAPGS